MKPRISKATRAAIKTKKQGLFGGERSVKQEAIETAVKRNAQLLPAKRSGLDQIVSRVARERQVIIAAREYAFAVQAAEKCMDDDDTVRIAAAKVRLARAFEQLLKAAMKSVKA